MIEYSLRELSRRWKRTVITVSGYIMAVAFLCLLLTAITGAERASGAILNSTGTHFVAYIPRCAGDSCLNEIKDREHEGFYVGSTQTRLLSNSMLEGIRTLSDVADASPYLLYRIRNSPGDETFLMAGLPLAQSAATANNSCSARDIKQGRFLEEGDGNAVVLEDSYAASAKLSVGESVRIGDESYAIVGIVDSGVRPGKADLYLSMENAERIIKSRITGELQDASSVFLIESKNAHLHQKALKDVRRLMGPEALLSGYNCYKPASKADLINRKGANLAAILVYICIVAFSLQAELHSVSERRHEIGILASIGWSRKDIVSQIVHESVIQSFAGWLIGSVLSVSAILLIPADSTVGRLPLMPEIYAFCLALAIASGVVAGFVPGMLAAAKKPADCLRRN